MDKAIESIDKKIAADLKAYLGLFQSDALMQLALTYVQEGKEITHFKNISGSYDAVLAALMSQQPGTHIFVMHDAEEASYFLNDLQHLLPEREVLYFPMSYKKPYQLTEIENANILQRAEVLNRISQKAKQGELVVTYPEALTEKVINQRSLLENTFQIKKGDRLDTQFIADFLMEYDFERTDFVYEAGQYAVRGGILDVFSYANEMPYRIEFFGDEVESIRTFDPVNQLSEKHVEMISIIPNVQTKLLQEVRESFLRFVPRGARIWFKDYQMTIDRIEEYFQSAKKDFQTILAKSGNTKVVHHPEDLFETIESFQKDIAQLPVIEFGNRFYLNARREVKFETKPQPSFHKDFNMLVADLDQYDLNGYTTILVAESVKQLERLRMIFQEIDPRLRFNSLNISMRAGFIDHAAKVVCYTDHQIFERFHQYFTKKKFSKSKSLTLKELRELKVGDYITHADYGIGRFAGMEIVEMHDRKQESIRLVFRDDDLLYMSVHALHKISKYSGQDGKAPQMSKLGSTEWEQKKSKVKKRVQDIAKDLIKLYAKRLATPGYQFSKDSYLQAELESSFLFEDTPDQAKATEDVKRDMEQPHPMDRLVCGDVGFGKTEVAIRAAFKAVCDSKQVAVLVPTTILAIQHYRTFKERLERFPCRVEHISRFRPAKEVKEVLKDLKDGKVDILIGTHKLTGQEVKFKNLGLLVIDEEQKFGVKTKEKLKQMAVNVDALTLTATPIPRTLHFSLLGARDLSIIATPPPNRQPVTTELHVFGEEVIRDAVWREIKRGGQVFFVHNRINDIESIANKIIELVPEARVCYAHGQMDGEKLEKIMMKFIEGEYDVLVSTNIIESGLDIPNANTILINQAHMFGMSDLHQMRGRVGRSNKKAYCYLLTPPVIGLTSEARKRLSTLEEFSDLGDGFKVAMRDLDIRGAGNLLGAEQSGFINDLGFEVYKQILEEAVQELKETEFRDLFKKDIPVTVADLHVECNIETDLEILIPEDYVTNISERLNLYIVADQLKNEEELTQFADSLKDRFGPLPREVKDLLETIRLRWKCEALGFEKLILKNNSFKASLVEHDRVAYYQSDIFGNILGFVKKNSRKCKLKEVQKRVILIIDDVSSIPEAMAYTDEMLGEKF